MAKTDRRERKKRETRNRILETSISLFGSQGFAATPIDQIAQEADVSRGTFFNYFPTKETLLHELAREEIQSLARRAASAPAHSPVAKIRHVMRTLVQDSRDFLDVTRYVLIHTLQSPAGDQSFDLQLGRILNQLVRRAQDAHEIRADLDPRDIALAILGVYLSTFFAWIGDEQRLDPNHAPPVETIVDILFEGIAGPRYPARDHEEPFSDDQDPS